VSERALVIVPTYNEQSNIARLIGEILEKDFRLDVLVIDDGSPDGTAEVVKAIVAQNPRVNLMERPGKMGLGTAYIAGFRWALERPYEYIFEMDADFSHDPNHLPQLLKAIETADLAIGSRYLEGRVTVANWPITRLLLSYGANVYARTLTGLKIYDATAGFKCFRRKVLEAIDLNQIKSTGYAFQIEMHFRTWKRGFHIVEIPIVFLDRTKGESKMSRGIVWESIWMVWRLRWLSIIGKI
jgi:dolichol-phosphate mannosyltransferase